MAPPWDAEGDCNVLITDVAGQSGMHCCNEPAVLMWRSIVCTREPAQRAVGLQAVFLPAQVPVCQQCMRQVWHFLAGRQQHNTRVPGRDIAPRRASAVQLARRTQPVALLGRAQHRKCYKPSLRRRCRDVATSCVRAGLPMPRTISR